MTAFLIHQDRHIAIDPMAIEQLKRDLVDMLAGKLAAVVVPAGVKVELVEPDGGEKGSGLPGGVVTMQGSGVGVRGKK